MAKDPAILIYPADWLKDEVSGCSLAAQGLWWRMLIVMHDSERRGYLQANRKPMTEQFIASKCGVDVPSYLVLLQELDDVAVPSRTAEGIIYNRRMVRDEEKRAQDRKRQQKHRHGDVTQDVTPVVTRLSVNANADSSQTVSTPQVKPPNPPSRGARKRGLFEPGLRPPKAGNYCGWCSIEIKPGKVACSQQCADNIREVRERQAN